MKDIKVEQNSLDEINATENSSSTKKNSILEKDFQKKCIIVSYIFHLSVLIISNIGKLL